MPTLSDHFVTTDQTPSCTFRHTAGWCDGREPSKLKVTGYLAHLESSRLDEDSCANQLSRLAEVSVKRMFEAQQAAQAKDDLLATVSHELRTPLNGILGMTGLLLTRDLPLVEREFVEVIRQSGETLLALVNDLLDFSKVEANCLELEITKIDPRVIIRDAIRMVQVSADQKGLRIVNDFDLNVPLAIEGDPLRLRQVLLNLLSNAIKFTPAGTITIRLDKISDATGNPVLCFTVTDEGIGISPEGQTRLFQPFSQADSSISRIFGGTGLGLAICKRLVELMGGSIGVRSEMGAGSSFWFTVRANEVTTTVPDVRRAHAKFEPAQA